MKNVAILVWGLKAGGAERIAGLLSKFLSETYKVYLFLIDTTGIMYEYSGTIIDVGYVGEPFVEREIRKNKEKYGIDISISFLVAMNIMNIRTRGKEKVIISERCVQSRFDPPLSAQQLKIQKYYNSADCVVACSHGVKEDLMKSYSVNKEIIDVIYNFSEMKQIRAKASEEIPSEIEEFTDNHDFFVCVGRIDQQKNHRRLIQQFALFHEDHPEVKLVVLGNGKEDIVKELENEIEILGVRDDICIFHFASNPFAVMKRAKAIISTSKFEGLPNVIIEAMCIGCPVISVDCFSGPRELLNDEKTYGFNDYHGFKVCKRGILVEDCITDDTGKTDCLKKAMDYLMAYPDEIQKVVQNGRNYMSDWSNESIVMRWREVIEKSYRGHKHTYIPEGKIAGENEKLYIYGTGNIAKRFFSIIVKENNISGFIVTRNDEQGKFFDLPVYSISEFKTKGLDTDAVIAICVSEFVEDEVVREIKNHRLYSEIVFPYV